MQDTKDDLDWVTNNDGMPYFSVPVVNDVAVYETEDCRFLCAPCARQENGSLAKIGHCEAQWNIVDVHALTNVNPWPDEHERGSMNARCAHCGGSLNYHNHNREY